MGVFFLFEERGERKRGREDLFKILLLLLLLCRVSEGVWWDLFFVSFYWNVISDLFYSPVLPGMGSVYNSAHASFVNHLAMFLFFFFLLSLEICEVKVIG